MMIRQKGLNEGDTQNTREKERECVCVCLSVCVVRAINRERSRKNDKRDGEREIDKQKFMGLKNNLDFEEVNSRSVQMPPLPLTL